MAPDPNAQDARTPEERLAACGIDLPRPAQAIANYAPSLVVGSLLFVSGQLPLQAGGVAPGCAGRVGAELTAEEGREAARLCAVNILAQARAALGDLNRVRRVVRLGGFIRAGAGFDALPAVMNGASDLMVSIFGEGGRHTRTTVGVESLPLGAAVEVDAIFEVA